MKQNTVCKHNPPSMEVHTTGSL